MHTASTQSVPAAGSNLAPDEKAKQASSPFKPFKPFKLSAICSTYVSNGILKQVQDDGVGKPFTAIRLPSVTSRDKQSAHARFTVTR
jgi:hypothetical protein